MKHRRLARIFTTTFLATLPLAGSAEDSLAAKPELHGGWFNIWVENDLVVKTDRHYTAGTKLAALMPERSIDDGAAEVSVAKWLPDFGLHPSAVRWGVGIEQDIYTPAETQAVIPPPNDRPYAGYLSSTWYLQKRGLTSGGKEELDQWSLDLGIVGPPSQAEEAQNTIHRLRDFNIAQGWGSQLHTEPAVNFHYVRTVRYATAGDHLIQAELVPQYGITGGTTYDFAQVGAQLRIGWNLSHDFGRRAIQDTLPGAGGRTESDGRGISFYVFGGCEGRVIGHNTLLDGNLFRDSRSVTKRYLVGDLKAGLGVAWARWELAYIQTIRSREYAGQPSVDSFGSLALTYRW